MSSLVLGMKLTFAIQRQSSGQPSHQGQGCVHAVLLMHLATNYVLVVVLKGGYLAAGAPYSLSRFYYFFVIQMLAHQTCACHWPNAVGPAIPNQGIALCKDTQTQMMLLGALGFC